MYGRVCWSDSLITATGPSLNLIKRNVPQSNVTGPNNNNVVTVTVIGNLYKERNTADISGEASETEKQIKIKTNEIQKL